MKYYLREVVPFLALLALFLLTGSCSKEKVVLPQGSTQNIGWKGKAIEHYEKFLDLWN